MKLFPQRYGDTAESRQGRNNRPSFLSGFLFSVVSVCLFADGFAADRGGERPAAYLALGVGGRQTAMGGAAAASSGDLASAFWNPAGLAGVRTFQAEGQFAFLSFDRTLGFLTFGNRLEKSPLSYSVSWVYFSAGDDLEFRTGPTIDPAGTFGDVQMAFFSSVAYHAGPRVDFGLNLKVLTHNLADAFGWGFGQDVGVQVRTSSFLALGFALRDAFTRMKFPNAGGEKVPPTLAAGFAYDHWESHLTWNLDGEWSSDRGLRPRVGAEWRPAGGLALRAGWGGKRLSGGFGVTASTQKTSQEFQYTALQDRLSGGLLHQVAVSLRFL